MSLTKAKIATRRAFGERVLQRGADDLEFCVLKAILEYRASRTFSAMRTRIAISILVLQS